MNYSLIYSKKEYPASARCYFNRKGTVKKIFNNIGIKNYKEKVFISSDIKTEIVFKLKSLLCFLSLYPTSIDLALIKKIDEVKKTLTLLISNTDSNGLIIQDIRLDSSSKIHKGTNVIKWLGKNQKHIDQKIASIIESCPAISNRNYYNIESVKNVIASERWLNTNKSKLKLVFSFNGPKVIKDLMSMSMRGAISCMRWDSHHSFRLAGAVDDACQGMVYLTDGTKTEHGEYIYYRRIIRLIKNKKNNTFALFLEKQYSFISDNSFLLKLKDIITNSLENKFGMKVYSSPQELNGIYDWEIPRIDSPILPQAFPCVDSGLLFSPKMSLESILNEYKSFKTNSLC